MLFRTLAGAAAMAAGLALASTTLARPAPGSPLLPPANSPRRSDPAFNALVGATVHVAPGKVIEKASVVMRDGLIVSVGATPPPAGATTHDATGLHIYAGFVEPYLEVDAPMPDRDQSGGHWSSKVNPDRSPLRGKGVDAASAEALRKMGYGAAAISPKGGIFRGSAALVSLAKADEDASQARPPVYSARVYDVAAFDTGRGGPGGGGADREDVSRWDSYPGSEMGVIALMRQTLSDAAWQQAEREARPGLPPSALDALAMNKAHPVPMAFVAGDELQELRARKVAGEFDRRAIVIGSGSEYQRLDAIVKAEGAGSAGLIVPLNYPKKPSVTSVADAEALGLNELAAWEQAPTNPRRLVAAGLKPALTTSKVKDRSSFWGNLRSAIRHGLKEDDALAMLTTTPAAILGATDQLGSVEAGKRANLVVADGPIFAKKTKVRDVWIDGKRHEMNAAPTNLKGEWEVTISPPPDKPGQLRFSINKDNAITVKKLAEGDEKKDATAKTKASRVEGKSIAFTFDHEPFGSAGIFMFSGTIEGETMTGDALRQDGRRFAWAAKRVAAEPVEPKKEEKKDEKKADAAAPDAKKDGAPDGKADAAAPDKKDEAKPEKRDADKKEAADPVVGSWSIRATGQGLPPEGVPGTLSVKRGGDGALSASVSSEHDSGDATSVSFDAGSGLLKVSVVVGGVPVEMNLSVKGEELSGSGSMQGAPLTFSGSRSGGPGKDDDEDDEPVKDVPEKLTGLPFGAYALEAPPEQGKVAFVNATVWTSGPAGVIKDGAVVIADGKIQYVGAAAGMPKLAADFVTVDCKGKHLTPAIIDCHSHTGISGGVNESGQTVTAEVRIGDVTNPNALNWYRQLAGGVGTVSSLHGSANPIGGQNQVNKIRWGVSGPDDMHFEGAIPGIKFALGENVKQSNWGDRNTVRYPQTRMGVETLIRDRFFAARDYAASFKRYDEQANRIKMLRIAPDEQARQLAALDRPRRDLELEALAEILDGKRIVHCHSYRQDEILMLARVAREFGFKIGTYQHILEGYKAAESVRESGGGSAFADWWAYKVEVQDAIPQAGAIMHEQGVVVSFNSDSDEMARRLSVEASKGHKYSRLADGSFTLSPEEALKFVTINPAKQLRIDARVGSIEVGKDADLALWTTDPLSSMTRCERTFVDGREYFSLEKDAALRKRDSAERNRLLQKVLAGSDKKKDAAKPDGEKGPPAGGPGGRPGRRPPQGGGEQLDDSLDASVAVAANTLVERTRLQAVAARRAAYLNLVRKGVDPADARMGDCGCDEIMWR